MFILLLVFQDDCLVSRSFLSFCSLLYPYFACCWCPYCCVSCRLWVKGALVLVVLLGLTWAIGLLYVSQHSIVMAYMFTLFNSLQGLFIFLFHCLMDERVSHGWGKVTIAYMFTLFNSLQGLFIFLFHCLMDERVSHGLGKVTIAYMFTLLNSLQGLRRPLPLHYGWEGESWVG